MNTAYREFIRYAINNEEVLPASTKAIDWQDFLSYSNRQGIVGLVFNGVERANPNINKDSLLEWISLEQLVAQKNIVTNKCLIEVADFFKKKNRRSCILKGQANGLMYPHPELRSPGDVDIWVEGNQTDIIRTVLKVVPDAHYSIHHIKFPVFKDVSIEVHYRPIYLLNWFRDKKLQKYINVIEDRQFSNSVSFEGGVIGCLTDDFNAVYQILHMYDHFFSTRNNFKQFFDYYYLLKKIGGDCDKKEIKRHFEDFGVLKYASGIMWIMKEILGIEEICLLVAANEKIGRAILRESDYFGTHSSNNLIYVFQQFYANLRLISLFPSEVLISPLFLVWHQWWRLKTKLSLRKRISEG